MAVKRPVVPKRKVVAAEIPAVVKEEEVKAVEGQAGAVEAAEEVKAPVLEAEETPEGFVVGGYLLPHNTTDLDGVTEEALADLYNDPILDAEVLAYQQDLVMIQTSQGPFEVPRKGVYVISINHPESDSYYVEFIRLHGQSLVFEGKWPSINASEPTTIELSVDPETRAHELDLIKQTMEWSR